MLKKLYLAKTTHFNGFDIYSPLTGEVFFISDAGGIWIAKHPLKAYLGTLSILKDRRNHHVHA